MTGLIGWWPLHRTSGDAVDLSGNGNHGTVSGPTRGVAGKAGLQGYDFERSNGDEVTVSGSSVWNGLSTLTVSAWIKPESLVGSSGRNCIVDINNYFQLNLEDSGKIWFRTYGNNNSGTSTTVSTGTWSHVAVTWDIGTEMKIFLDGSRLETVSSSNTGTTNNTLYIGDINSNGKQFDGVITDVRFYDRLLSANEVQKLYDWGNADVAQPPGSSDSGAVSRWKFNGDVTDSWGSNDGTDNTSAGYVTGIRGGSNNAKDFDGSDDYVDCGSGPFNGASAPFSFSTWFNVDSSTEARIFDKNNLFMCAYDKNGNNRLQIGTYGKNTGNNGPKVSTGVWYHVYGMWDPSNNEVEIYLNGSLSHRNTSFSDGIDSTSGVLYIGKGSGGNPLDGSIDDFRLYNRALKPWEVFQLYLWGTKGRDMRRLTVNQR